MTRMWNVRTCVVLRLMRRLNVKLIVCWIFSCCPVISLHDHTIRNIFLYIVDVRVLFINISLHYNPIVFSIIFNAHNFVCMRNYDVLRRRVQLNGIFRTLFKNLFLLFLINSYYLHVLYQTHAFKMYTKAQVTMF